VEVAEGLLSYGRTRSCEHGEQIVAGRSVDIFDGVHRRGARTPCRSFQDKYRSPSSSFVFVVARRRRSERGSGRVVLALKAGRAREARIAVGQWCNAGWTGARTASGSDRNHGSPTTPRLATQPLLIQVVPAHTRNLPALGVSGAWLEWIQLSEAPCKWPVNWHCLAVVRVCNVRKRVQEEQTGRVTRKAKPGRWEAREANPGKN
jgi:hypothetical protein